jgi:hypothetical protein
VAGETGCRNGSKRHPGNRSGDRRAAARMSHGDYWRAFFRPRQPAGFDSGWCHRAPGILRPGGCRGCVRSAFRRRGRGGPAAAAMDPLRPQRRARAPCGRPTAAGRRVRRGGAGPGRYSGAGRAPHLAHFLVPFAPRRGAHAHRADCVRAAIERQNLRQPDAGIVARAHALVGRHARFLPPARRHARGGGEAQAGAGPYRRFRYRKPGWKPGTDTTVPRRGLCAAWTVVSVPGPLGTE